MKNDIQRKQFPSNKGKCASFSFTTNGSRLPSLFHAPPPPTAGTRSWLPRWPTIFGHHPPLPHHIASLLIFSLLSNNRKLNQRRLMNALMSFSSSSFWVACGGGSKQMDGFGLWLKK
ncbi:hypothetical protein Dimus_001235 [Dionaea muscipula]